MIIDLCFLVPDRIQCGPPMNLSSFNRGKTIVKSKNT
jgi:hypothetical protein